MLQCGKQVLLTGNTAPDYLSEIRESGERLTILTDQDIPDALHIPSLISGTPVDSDAVPRIDPEETSIILYTSGTTGKPKAVFQRLAEFETDNRFILSKWGDEITARKVCSTVSQHHIYGLLFSILLPFTAGVPFRRRRIRHPEELERFAGDSYLLITVPAFLKRAVEIKPECRLESPWIFTSGGALAPETAEETEKAFGFYPWEIYGSTETSGIAYRQSKNGLAWTPFDNAEIRINDEGRLVVRSPYIKDPAGFVTGDEAEILGDGRFLLKGRADGVVKIEEKRVSLAEVERRLLQSGLVSDAAAVALEDRRQYLGAAVVLNDAGKKRFAGLEKREINQYFSGHLRRFFEGIFIPKKWRFTEALPADAQGKKSYLGIKALFTADAVRDISDITLLDRSDATAVLEIYLPETSEYFDGHFPERKILPGVAQVELAVRLCDRYFGAGLGVAKAKRIKFSRSIGPNTLVRLELEYNAGSMAFKMTSPDGKTVYSSGTCVFSGGF
ncbi:MAG: AMP-binding protein [Spirochaetaceae bacterium]|nr:AMP-binding protein [Spirochaetaceae bacterium]